MKYFLSQSNTSHGHHHIPVFPRKKIVLFLMWFFRKRAVRSFIKISLHSTRAETWRLLLYVSRSLYCINSFWQWRLSPRGISIRVLLSLPLTLEHFFVKYRIFWWKKYNHGNFTYKETEPFTKALVKKNIKRVFCEEQS